MLKKIILTATMVAMLVSSTACNKAIEHCEYSTTAVFYEDLKNPGTGIFLTEDAHYTVDSVNNEFDKLNNECWYVVTFDNNGTNNKTDDIIVSWVALS